MVCRAPGNSNSARHWAERTGRAIKKFISYRFFLLGVLGGGGTFAPSFRAAASPMAIACFGFFTFLPLFPLLSRPRFISCMASFTDSRDFLPYLAMVPPIWTLNTASSRSNEVAIPVPSTWSLDGECWTLLWDYLSPQFPLPPGVWPSVEGRAAFFYLFLMNVPSSIS